MKILDVSVRNFRCFGDFRLQLGEESLFLIGESGTGKTTFLDAIAHAFGRDRRFTRPDFGDLEEPIEITVTIGDLRLNSVGLSLMRLILGNQQA